MDRTDRKRNSVVAGPLSPVVIKQGTVQPYNVLSQLFQIQRKLISQPGHALLHLIHVIAGYRSAKSRIQILNIISKIPLICCNTIPNFVMPTSHLFARELAAMLIWKQSIIFSSLKEACSNAEELVF